MLLLFMFVLLLVGVELVVYEGLVWCVFVVVMLVVVVVNMFWFCVGCCFGWCVFVMLCCIFILLDICVC